MIVVKIEKNLNRHLLWTPCNHVLCKFVLVAYLLEVFKLQVCVDVGGDMIMWKEKYVFFEEKTCRKDNRKWNVRNSLRSLGFLFVLHFRITELWISARLEQQRGTTYKQHGTWRRRTKTWNSLKWNYLLLTQNWKETMKQLYCLWIFPLHVFETENRDDDDDEKTVRIPHPNCVVSSRFWSALLKM